MTIATDSANLSVSQAETNALKDMYQHVVPRFILRQFSGVQSPQKQEDRYVWKTGNKPCYINIYDLRSGSLSLRPLSSAYGQINLYRNPRETTDVDYLEHRLGNLEQAASTIIRRIHDGISSNSISLYRTELATLRKFIFLMHFRSVAASAYFDEDNPLMADWTKTFKHSRGLETDIEVWKEALKYYLDTPHKDIVATGEALPERYGTRLHQTLRPRVDPDLEEKYLALKYEWEANYYFLGVWVAPAGSEFVLSGNSFGLWEGQICGRPGIHKVHVVSPRVALVLRRTVLRAYQPQSNNSSMINSTLIHIPIHQRRIVRAEDAFENVDLIDDVLISNPEIRNAYRMTPAAQADTFTFPFTNLSADQTFCVNEIILMNASSSGEGSVTFAARQAMQITLDRYIKSHHAFLAGKNMQYLPLLSDLRSNALAKKSRKSKTSVVTNDASPSIPVDSIPDSDHTFRLLLRTIAAGGIRFPSPYDRASLVYHMSAAHSPSTNPISIQIQLTRNRGIVRLQDALASTTPYTSQTPVALSFYKPKKLVPSLSKPKSDIFFRLIGKLVDSASLHEPSNDLLANIVYEASMVGVLCWLAHERIDVLKDTFNPFVRLLI